MALPVRATRPTITPMPAFAVKPLGMPWITADPFLFCVHHDDHYPRGDQRMAPVASLAGREIGADFSGKDGWSMYHGDVVPGFPAHPHRGFETVTIARRGFIDHSDSLGATARFGKGDVQWLTAGKGIVHCEMFPLLEREQDNPAELFQIWLNLPRRSKMATPHFTMLWHDTIPRRTITDDAGRTSELVLVAGDPASPPPPPESWAADPASGVAIWTVAMAPGARLTLPGGPAAAKRSLYFFAGTGATVDGTAVRPRHGLFWSDAPAITIDNGDAPAEFLMLQGRPIGEPVVQYGPFVMNTREEIQQAFVDYQRTQFGGWPWPAPDPVHPRDAGRFARRPDGSIEQRG